MVWIDTVGYSLLTGGLVATTVELIHYAVRTYRRKKFIIRLKDFFTELNNKIQTISDSDDGTITQPMARYAIFKGELDDAKTLISAHQTYLKAKELSEIQEIINQELRLIQIIPSNRVPDKKLYELFFDRLVRLEWLKFIIE